MTDTSSSTFLTGSSRVKRGMAEMLKGGVSRMSDPDMIDKIIDAVSVPVMAKARIGHFVEAQVLQALGVDYIDESEVLTPADAIPQPPPPRRTRLVGDA